MHSEKGARFPKEIVILPVFHHPDSVAFVQAMVHFRKLPKGSQVFLEIHEKPLASIGSRLHSLDYDYLEKHKGSMSHLNVIFEAAQRGISLFPMEALPLAVAGDRILMTQMPDLAKMVDLNFRREVKFVENIRNQANPAKKVFVLTGANHALAIEKLLKAHGVRVNVELSMYSDENRKDIERSMRLESRLRDAIRSGDTGETNRISMELAGISKKLFLRKAQFGTGPAAFLGAVRAWKEKSMERAKRRASAHMRK